MKFFVTIIAFLCLQFVADSLQGQSPEHQITGMVLDSIDQPINDVLITLYSKNDSAIVASTLTLADGNYVMQTATADNYFLSATAIGYGNYVSAVFSISPNKIITVMPTIHLFSNGTLELASVEIVSKKPFVEQSIDRIIIHPEALISNAGTTALDVLEKSPGVRVDLDGNISLKGKGVLVFIDDKPTYLAPADLAGYLRSLPSESLENIEIMTNPPAKYDAAGTGGIINIKIKKTKKTGVNGGINLSYAQGRYPKSNNSANINYRINRFNFYSNVGYNLYNTFQDLDINRVYYNEDGSLSSTFYQNTFIKIENASLTGKLGTDFYINDKSTIGVSFSGFNSILDNNSVNNAEVKDSLGQLQNNVITNSPSTRDFMNGNVNVNYDVKLGDKGKQITVQLDYLMYNSDMEQQLLTQTYLPGNIFVGESNLVSFLPTILSIKSGKLDYLSPLNKGGRLDAGFKSSIVDADNIADFSDEVDGTLTPNYIFSNHFIYNENINAAYLNYSKSAGVFSFQFGLRFENTNITGNQLGNPLTPDSTFTRNLYNIFPTAYMQYQIDTVGKHILGFSYGRRIDRPNYKDLNPFTYPLDLFTLYEGNPFLEPTFSHNFELSHTFNSILTTTALLSVVNDVINETIEQRDGVFYSRPGNISDQLTYGVSVNGMFNITDWWSIQVYSELMYNSFDATLYGQSLKNAGTHWYVGPVNQFKVKESWAFELSGNYQTSVYSGQFITIPSGAVRFGVSKKIMDNNGTIKLNVSDIFYTNQPGGDIKGLGNSTANWYSYLDTRVLTLSFGYRFNKGQGLQARSTNAPDEKSRVQ